MSHIDMQRLGIEPEDPPNTRLEQALARITELEEEQKEHDATFDLRWKADMRAIKMWQQAHPGRPNIWPDHADMVVWLMKRIAELEAELDQLRAGNMRYARLLAAALTDLDNLKAEQR